MNDYNFGNFVCLLREQKGLTQAEVARQLGVTPAAVSKWENGSSKPRVDILFKLAEILEVRSEELMAGHRFADAALDEEAVAQINQRYEYLMKVDSFATMRVKLRRLLAWAIDWNVIGFLVIVAVAVFMSLFREAIDVGSVATIAGLLLLIISYPILFVFRDLIFGGRSLGKRITGLMILDRQTGAKASRKALLVRNIFFFLAQIDVIFMLVSGTSIGDRVANTVVVSKKVSESTFGKISTDVDKIGINDYKAPSRISVKTVVIILSAFAAIIVLLIGFVLVITFFALEAQKDTDTYKMAYEYLVESERFVELGVEEEDIRLNSYSNSSSVTEDGSMEKRLEYGFNVGNGRKMYVICHVEDGEWYVCPDCTHFE